MPGAGRGGRRLMVTGGRGGGGGSGGGWMGGWNGGMGAPAGGIARVATGGGGSGIRSPRKPFCPGTTGIRPKPRSSTSTCDTLRGRSSMPQRTTRASSASSTPPLPSVGPGRGVVVTGSFGAAWGPQPPRISAAATRERPRSVDRMPRVVMRGRIVTRPRPDGSVALRRKPAADLRAAVSRRCERGAAPTDRSLAPRPPRRTPASTGRRRPGPATLPRGAGRRGR